MKVVILLLLTSILSVHYVEAKTLSDVSKSTTIRSEADLVSILEATQQSFQGISPPSESVFITADKTPYPVDWSGFDKKTTKYMTANMDRYGLPRYTLLIYEDVATRDRVILLATTGGEVARIPARSGYVPELYYTSLLSRGATYNEFTRWIFDPAHTAIEIEMIPKTMFVAYEQYEADRIAAQETEEASMEAAMAPMLMTLPEIVTDLMMGINTHSNGTVELELRWPLYFENALEIYASDDLVSNQWKVASDKLSTLGMSSLLWEDNLATNTQRYYRMGDADTDSDGDGLPDAREIVVTHSSIEETDSDYDQLPDGFEYLWGLDPNETNDVSVDDEPDGLMLYGEYLQGCDPTLADSDLDGILDGDDLYPSADKPLIQLISPIAGSMVTSLSTHVEGIIEFEGDDLEVTINGQSAAVVNDGTQWIYATDLTFTKNGTNSIYVQAAGFRNDILLRNALMQDVDVLYYAPSLSIMSPPDGVALNSLYVHVTVLSSEMASVSANGVAMSRDGFVNYAWVELLPGSNTIAVSSMGASGGSSGTAISVVCDVPAGYTEDPPTDQDMDAMLDFRDPSPDDPSITGRIIVTSPVNGISISVK